MNKENKINEKNARNIKRLQIVLERWEEDN